MLFSQYLDMMDSACKGTTLFLYDKILAQKKAAELRSCPSDVRCTCGAVQSDGVAVQFASRVQKALRAVQCTCGAVQGYVISYHDFCHDLAELRKATRSQFKGYSFRSSTAAGKTTWSRFKAAELQFQVSSLKVLVSKAAEQRVKTGSWVKCCARVKSQRLGQNNRDRMKLCSL